MPIEELPDATSPPHVVLFACIQNAGRSQMAQALFNKLVMSSSARAISAGSRPSQHVHPEVVGVMQEIGIDLSKATPQKLTAQLAATANILVTMGCREECPFIPGVRVIAWQLTDPDGQDVAAVRVVRELLKEKVLELARTEGYQLS